MLRHSLATLACTIIAASGMASIAAADPSDRGYLPAAYSTGGESQDYVGLRAPGQPYAARSAAGAGRGSRATVWQGGTNNSTTIRQRGDNKTVIVVQRGSDTDVTIDQHGDGPGGAIVYTW